MSLLSGLSATSDVIDDDVYSTWDPGIAIAVGTDMTSQNAMDLTDLSSFAPSMLALPTTNTTMTSSVTTPSLWSLSENNWQVLPLILIVIAGITGNVLVCMAVAMQRSLQNVTNYFLTSLAIADLFVCCVVMPLSIMTEFMGKYRKVFK